MNEEIRVKTTVYALKLADHTITPEEFEELNSILSADPQAARHYNCIMMAISDFRERGKEIIDDEVRSESVLKETFWNEMSEYEKKAPEIEVPYKKPQRELLQKIVYPPRENRKMNKFSKVFLALNAAAILFVLFLKFAPPRGGIEVATLTDSIHAKWANVTNPMQKGTRLSNDNVPLQLREGFVEIKFDSNVQVTIEGPAEFQVLDDDMMKLSYGQLYFQVPPEAYGFQICTQHTKIIDLGTEFGIKEGLDGDTEVHVLKGRVNFISNILSKKINVNLPAGSARKLDAERGELKEIPCKDNLFARHIDSTTEIIWRVQSLDLADIVRGGNGFGTGNSDVRLNPIKGFTRDFHGGFSTAKGYLAIPELAFIDGVFVPDVHAQQIVSSRNDVFAECPETSGIFDMDLFANPKSGILKTDLREGTIEFNGREYTDESGHPCILMHSNLGLTFDLDAIRKHYRRDITRFTSRAGIADLKEDCPCNADFWVLVDGQVRYSLRQYKQKGVLNDVSVEIKDTDRFLTLVTTDGGDPDYPEGGFYKRAISCDWCVFTEPVLELE